MKAINIEDRISYIQSLDIGEPALAVAGRKKLAFVAEDDKKAAAVDAGSLVSFVGGVSAIHQQDTLNSTLLAQLAANQKYDREEQTVDWYKFYRDVLENIGWVIQGFNFNKFDTQSASFSVDEVVIKLLAAIATDDDVAIVAETIEAVKALSNDDGRVVLFDSQSHKLKKGNFQIGIGNDDDGVMVMKMGAFYFSTSKDVTNVLWFRFERSDSEMYQASQTINLNEQIYAKVRQQVIDKLGVRAQEFVLGLDIGAD